MSGRRADEERGEGIGVGRGAVLGGDPATGGGSEDAARGTVAVSVPESGAAARDAERAAAGSAEAAATADAASARVTESGGTGAVADGVAPASGGRGTGFGTDSASRLNSGQVSFRGVDRGGHVHRVDMPKTPAQGGDRDGLGVAPGQPGDPEGVTGMDRGDFADDGVQLADLSGPEQVGRRLQLARRRAGLSVEALADRTRIRGTMIRQIELGDFGRCGGDIYARGHVRALAKALGVDPEAVLAGETVLVVEPAPGPGPARGSSGSGRAPGRQPKQRVAARARVVRPARGGGKTGGRGAGANASAAAAGSGSGSGSAPESGGAAGTTVRSGAAFGLGESFGSAAAGSGYNSRFPAPVPMSRALRRAQRRDRRDRAGAIGGRPKTANWTAAMLVTLLGLVVFAGTQLVGDDKSTPAAAAHVPPPAAAKPAAPVAPPVVAAPTGVALKIAAVDAGSWLAVYDAKGNKLFDNMLNSGAAQSFQDPAQLDVTFGNAAAIRMQLNGKDVGTVGGDGQVVHMVVKPTGATAG